MGHAGPCLVRGTRRISSFPVGNPPNSKTNKALGQTNSLQCGSYPWSNIFDLTFRHFVSLWTLHSGKKMTGPLAFLLLLSKLASDVTSEERSDNLIQIPASFTEATIEVLSLLQPAFEPRDITMTEARQLLPSKLFASHPFAFQDGGGGRVLPAAPNVLLDLRQSWMSFLLRIQFHCDCGTLFVQGVNCSPARNCRTSADSSTSPR